MHVRPNVGLSLGGIIATRENASALFLRKPLLRSLDLFDLHAARATPDLGNLVLFKPQSIGKVALRQASPVQALKNRARRWLTCLDLRHARFAHRLTNIAIANIASSFLRLPCDFRI